MTRLRQAANDDIIVVDHSRYGIIIKRLNVVDGGLHLSGDDPDSTDMDQLGTITPEQIKGVVVSVIGPRGLRRPV